MNTEPKARIWLYPLILLGGIAIAWFLFLFVLDYLIFFQSKNSFWSILSIANANEVIEALGNLPEVVIAILGIVITVVSIILQLSATRYTPRVTEMFFKDRTNLLVLGFFVVTASQCIWVTFAVRQLFIPPVLVTSTLVIMTASILLLIPYFIYVFHFLEPERVVKRLQQQSVANALGKKRHVSMGQRQQHVLEGVEQLADVAINAVAQKDRIIASRSVDALKDLATHYLSRKADLEGDWFQIGDQLRNNPDFVVMDPENLQDIGNACTWLEWKILRQYQVVYNQCLNQVSDICQLIAINTRYLGENALAYNDHHLLNVVVKFFNTYLRSAINKKDIRTAYNVLHQYRQLTEKLLHLHWEKESIELANYFKYYGQTANANGLSFVTETAAYDLCTLCELAHKEQFPKEEELLAILLEVDKAPETAQEELSLRGVRKAQIKLATFYLAVGCENLARKIWHDMEEERPERLRSIREELSLVKDKDFWEVVDRGHNFDYLSPVQRDKLEIFFSWFPSGCRIV